MHFCLSVTPRACASEPWWDVIRPLGFSSHLNIYSGNSKFCSSVLFTYNIVLLQQRESNCSRWIWIIAHFTSRGVSLFHPALFPPYHLHAKRSHSHTPQWKQTQHPGQRCQPSGQDDWQLSTRWTSGCCAGGQCGHSPLPSWTKTHRSRQCRRCQSVLKPADVMLHPNLNSSKIQRNKQILD